MVAIWGRKRSKAPSSYCLVLWAKEGRRGTGLCVDFSLGSKDSRELDIVADGSGTAALSVAFTV